MKTVAFPATAGTFSLTLKYYTQKIEFFLLEIVKTLRKEMY